MIRFITGRDFLDKVCPILGLDHTKIRRVIIDAKYDDVVFIYAEQIGDARLLDIIPPAVECAKVVVKDEEGGAL